jgi:hypothetical protein
MVQADDARVPPVKREPFRVGFSPSGQSAPKRLNGSVKRDPHRAGLGSIRWTGPQAMNDGPTRLVCSATDP